MVDNNCIFHLDTKNTSYIFRIAESGHLEHLFYGSKIRKSNNYEALFKKYGIEEGNAIRYNDSIPKFTLDNINLEYSGVGKGDFREPACEIVLSNGSFTTDFLYSSHEMYKGKKKIDGLPCAHDEDNSCDTLEIILKDKTNNLELKLYYHIFYEFNVITRHVTLKNNSEEKIDIRRLMSLQLDIDNSNYHMVTFNGVWTREMERSDVKLINGRMINDSKSGTSSNRHNPFVMIREENTTETSGKCYGMNLIYSGNHIEVAEVNYGNKLRILTGINPHCFSYDLNKGEQFNTPEAILTFSKEGLRGLSRNMHGFINNHIIPARFKDKERPILINNWEATYFKFDHNKIISIAKEAAEMGVELFVLDDGWFGERNDDTSSLGDWFVNSKKLSKGLNGLCEDINKLGMNFGLWVEPEMISEKSELYKKNPHWAIKNPTGYHSTGRNQMILDLTKDEVRDYLVNSLSDIFASTNITYVKWDMNRNFSDIFSNNLTNQGELFHKYVLGLYNVIDRLTNKFPDILFEGCASGGNRFDLGMLYYMPQIWASDNTDAVERVRIQTGLSYGYPISTIGSHVSDCPNHQTLRTTSIETRFNVAAFGVLGYELNLKDLDSISKKIVKNQIQFYKKYRKVLQFGDFFRIKDIYNSNNSIWIVVSKEKDIALLFYYQNNQQSHPYEDVIKTTELDSDTLYKVSLREQKLSVKDFGSLINHVTPINIKNEGILQHVISKVYNQDIEKEDIEAFGDMLNEGGFKPKEQFSGCGYNENIRVMGDFSSRIYIIESK